MFVISTEIYYFSGTGNSLHVAKELQKRIPEAKLIPMVSLLKQDVIEITSETVGLVLPIYLMTVPVPARNFLKKLDLKSTQYIFAVATRAGTLSLADIYLKKLLKQKGKSLASYFILNMVNNSPTGLKPTPGDKDWVNQITREKIAELETEVQHQLDLIHKVIINQKKYPEKDQPHPLKSFLEPIISGLTENSKTEINYYTDATCTGCGICERVCLSKKIKMVNKKPVWQKDIQCYYCYACFNFCPEQAILVKKLYTQKDGRYFHPEITANDIGGQKC